MSETDPAIRHQPINPSCTFIKYFAGLMVLPCWLIARTLGATAAASAPAPAALVCTPSGKFVLSSTPSASSRRPQVEQPHGPRHEAREGRRHAARAAEAGRHLQRSCDSRGGRAAGRDAQDHGGCPHKGLDGRGVVLHPGAGMGIKRCSAYKVIGYFMHIK